MGVDVSFGTPMVRFCLVIGFRIEEDIGCMYRESYLAYRACNWLQLIVKLLLKRK